MKHTPGPWRLVDRSEMNTRANDPRWVIDDDAGKEMFWIALCINEANAHLIAAAPELLDSLKDAAQIMRECSVDCAGTPTEGFFSEHAATYERLIAKAEGQQ